MPLFHLSTRTIRSHWRFILNRYELILIIATVLALLRPWIATWYHPTPVSKISSQETIPISWPKTWQDNLLIPMKLTARERYFSLGFPGEVARFHTGQHEIILRWVTAATRRLHPASDCLQGVGYTITPLPAEVVDSVIRHCFKAVRGKDQLRVCEWIITADGTTSWPEPSAWYWSALLQQSPPPWWAWTVAETM